jgi:hypothetical protein
MDDYSNLTTIVPEGNRTVAHAVQVGGTRPECLPRDAEMVLPTDDLWVLPQSVSHMRTDCLACVERHG